MDYLPFEILLERSGTRYRARVVGMPAEVDGAASAVFERPFAPRELAELERLLLRRSGNRGPEPNTENRVREFGERLFASVFGGEVGRKFGQCRALAVAQDKGLRVRLRIASPSLREYPWECLRNPELGFLALTEQTPIVRYVPQTEPLRELATGLPLNVLVAVAGPTDQAKLDAEAEWQSLESALRELIDQGKVTLTRLEHATFACLRAQLRSEGSAFHVFHFIGHGEYTKDEGYLLFESPQGGAERVTGDRLGIVLGSHRSLGLVFVNACESARPSPTFAGVAQSIVRSEVPAVIAMQFAISDHAAITFSHDFYKEVAAGRPIDAAVSIAREAILAEREQSCEWLTPVLFMGTADGRIFDLRSDEERAQRDETVAAALAAARSSESAGATADAVATYRKVLELDGDCTEAREAVVRLRGPAAEEESEPPTSPAPVVDGVVVGGVDDKGAFAAALERLAMALIKKIPTRRTIFRLRKVIGGSFLGLAGVTLALFSIISQTRRSLDVMLVGPQTGEYAIAWQGFLDGWLLADRDIKDDRSFRLACEGCNPPIASDDIAEVAERILARRPDVVIGPFTSTAAERLAPAIARAGALHILPAATATRLLPAELGRGEAERPTTFRLVADDSVQAAKLWQVIAGHQCQPGPCRVALFGGRNNPTYDEGLVIELLKNEVECRSTKGCPQMIFHGSMPSTRMLPDLLLRLRPDVLVFATEGLCASWFYRQLERLRADCGARASDPLCPWVADWQPSIVLTDAAFADGPIAGRALVEGSKATLPYKGKTADYSDLGRDARQIMALVIEKLQKRRDESRLKWGPDIDAPLLAEILQDDVAGGLEFEPMKANDYKFGSRGENRTADFHLWKVVKEGPSLEWRHSEITAPGQTSRGLGLITGGSQ